MKNKARRGQVMFMTIAIMGSAILGATAIAGLLTVYEIRQATDLGQSTKAIYAADAGIEWAFFIFYCHLKLGDNHQDCRESRIPPPADFEQGSNPKEMGFNLDGILGTGHGSFTPKDVTYRLKIDGAPNPNNYRVPSSATRIISTGIAGLPGRQSTRAFILTF